MPEKPASKTSASLVALMSKLENEPIASFLKIKVLELSPGYAKVSMLMRPEYINFNGVVFGAIIMSIADYAFALAINSVSLPSLATQFNVHLLSPAKPGDELIAEGKVLHSGRRTGVTEMQVINQEGKLIATASGTTVAPIT